MSRWIEVPAKLFLQLEDDVDLEAFLEQFRQEVYENVPLYQETEHIGLEFEVERAIVDEEGG